MKIRLGSITYAIKAKEVLASHGIDAGLVKDLRSARGGCVYALTFQEQYRDVVCDILGQAGFEIPAEELNG